LKGEDDTDVDYSVQLKKMKEKLEKHEFVKRVMTIMA